MLMSTVRCRSLLRRKMPPDDNCLRLVARPLAADSPAASGSRYARVTLVRTQGITAVGLAARSCLLNLLHDTACQVLRSHDSVLCCDATLQPFPKRWWGTRPNLL